MIMQVEDLTIKLTTPDDTEIKMLSEKSNDLVNMSETRLYPVNTPTEMVFRIENKNELIGEIKFSRMRWYNRKSELSILIKKEHQNKGYGTKALNAAMHYAFDKMNLHRLEAEVYDFNEASIKLVEKLGFKKEGVLREAKYLEGKYYDIIRYGILKREFK